MTMQIQNINIIHGNLTRDPELRYTSAGHAVCSFSVAVNERKRNAETGKWEDGDTSFFNVSCWRTLAENVAESFHKGDKVLVVGQMRQRSYENDAGEKRTVYEVTADVVGASLDFATVTVERVKREERVKAGAASSNGGGYDAYDHEPF